MTIAGVASNLENAQTRAFPCGCSHSPVKVAFRVPKTAITELFTSSNPAKRASHAENNGRPAPPSTPWPTPPRPPAASGRFAPLQIVSRASCPPLKVQNATVFTPTAVRRTGGRVRWPSRERSLGPKLPLAPEASSALGERTFGNRQTKRLSSLTGLFGAPDGTRGPRDQSRGYSRLPKGLNIHRRPSALKAPRGRHSIAQGAATKRSPGSASHQKAPSKSPNGARQATLVGPACAASFADGRHAHGSL
jgi:hypothetical protein